MVIRLYKSYTPGIRHHVNLDFSNLTKTKPERLLLQTKKKTGGRNNRGVITVRHRGGDAIKLH